MFDATRIQEILPHRYPFLLIDTVVEFEEHKRAKALKCVSINEPFFSGHFPQRAVMPGALILEAMAQTSAIILGSDKGKTGFLTSVYEAHFLKPVVPGDRLILESRIIQKTGALIRFKATATVDETVVAKAELGIVILDKPATA